MKKANRFHKKLTALVLAGLMAMSASTALAANTVELGLDDSIQMALENNRSIKQSIARAPQRGADALLGGYGEPRRRQVLRARGL